MKIPDHLPDILSSAAETAWDGFQHAAQIQGIELWRDPELTGAVKKVFAFSRFVSGNCIRLPAILTDLVESGDLYKKYVSNDYNHKLKNSLFHLSGSRDEAQLLAVLRKTRRREMIRIAFRDLSGMADLDETMADLSAFADACLSNTLDVLYDNQCLTHGIPRDKKGEQQLPVVVAMGKLGAKELNFSSDIDLIFAYPVQGQTTGGETSVSNEEFFTRLCRRLIHVIGGTTEDGIVFRVDMRLRPYGESGAIIMNFEAMEDYYQIQGREWERYAWIKARIAAGNIKAGEQLLKNLTPFVYRRYLDYGAFESLRKMKREISLEIKRKGMQNNIKLGPGGIREIEFFGQVFQLIRGGVQPVLQEQRIQKVLQILAEEMLIPEKVSKELLKAYEFLRKTEHRLQEFSDQQTHKLPTDDLDKMRLALSMGFDSRESFEVALKRFMTMVHEQFDNLLEHKKTEKDKDQKQSDAGGFKYVWETTPPDRHCLKILESNGFDEPEKILQQLEDLKNATSTQALTGEGRIRLDTLMPFCLKAVSKTEHPEIVMNRIVDLLKTIEQRTCYLSLLIENPSVLDHLAKLADGSPWIVAYLTKHPVLLDELLDPRTLYVPPARDELEDVIGKRLKSVPADDLEYQIQELCIFKQVNVLRVAAADVTGALPLMRTSDYLTDIAETVLKQVLELAWNHLVEKHGNPQCKLNDSGCDKGFCVIAYGKLGGIELGYGSDLDLVFLHAGVEGQTKGSRQPIDNAQFFARLGQRAIHLLTTRTGAGSLYEIDMRLRPSGSSGILVSHIEAFKEYQEKNAWTWEHQALIKARPVTGDPMLAGGFETIRKDVLTVQRNRAKLREEVVNMRERMKKELAVHDPDVFDLKQGNGGIVDIEFLVQYLVLWKCRKYHQLVKWTDNVRILETLIETGIIDSETARFLKEAYLSYRLAVHRLSLQEKPAIVPADQFKPLRKKVEKAWNLFLKS